MSNPLEVCLVARWCSQQWVCLLLLGKSLKVRSQIPNGFHKSAFCFLLRSLDDDGGSSTHWDRSPKMSPPFSKIRKKKYCKILFNKIFFDLRNISKLTYTTWYKKVISNIFKFKFFYKIKFSIKNCLVLHCFKIGEDLKRYFLNISMSQCDNNSYSEQFKATYYLVFITIFLNEPIIFV